MLNLLSGHPRLVTVLDVIVAFTWVSHLNVFVWRGAWNLIDHYILPDYPKISAVVTAVFGMFVRMVIKSCMPMLYERVTKKNMVSE